MNEDIEYAHSAIDPFWRWHETLTVFEATAIICGHDPNEVNNRVSDTYFAQAYPRFGVVNLALGKALRKGDIEGSNMPLTEVVWNDTHDITNTTDTNRSELDRDSLVAWLRSKGHTTGFFFPDTNTTDTPGYLDPNNPRYSFKLAAAVKAWEAVTVHPKMTAKQGLEKWLREHAVDFELTNEEGNPVEAAMKECSTVANWQTKGGASNTPNAEPTPLPG